MGFFYLICLAAFCLNFAVSAVLRKKWPKKMWPECLLAVLGLTAFGTVVYSIFGVGGWEGMGLGLPRCLRVPERPPVMPLRCVYGSSDRIKNSKQK
nr:YesK-like family protein [Bacillus velezensis]